jgi:hypothetical protein
MGARRTNVIRCFRLKHRESAWLSGLGTRRGPRLEFARGASLRSLGPLGVWVREG